MARHVTPLYGWIFPDDGADVDVWGPVNFTAFDAIDTQVKANENAAIAADAKAVTAQVDADTADAKAVTADAKAVTADGKAVTAQATADAAMPLAGGSMSGKLTLEPSSIAAATLRFPPSGDVPTTPINGDFWFIGDELFYQGGGQVFLITAVQQP